MPNISIREARESDLVRILEVYREAGIESEPAFTPEEASAQLAWFKRYPSYRVFVAEVGSEIAGTYELLIMDNLDKRGRRSGIVEVVAVAPRYQGSGVGRAMMQHAMRQCHAAGCYKLVVSSNLKRTEAHAFYRTLGFKRHGYSFHVTLNS
jgi:GNAT superfamily N-acetyltransferase